MKLAICNELFEGWNWERVCDFVHEFGYQGIEIAPFTLAPHADQVTPQQRAQLRKTAEERDLQLVGLHWLLAKTTGLHITHPDPGVRRQTADYFRQLVALCADLGGKVLVIGSPKQRSLLPAVTYQQALNYAVEVFQTALDDAARKNITLAIEPLSPKETDFIQTAADGIQLIERINHPSFRLHLDVKAMSAESPTIDEIIRASARHLAHFHVNDPNLLGPGMGEVPFEPIIAALRQSNYKGWLSVEVFDFTPGPEKIARDSIQYLRKILA